jgi:hypothetical protein
MYTATTASVNFCVQRWKNGFIACSSCPLCKFAFLSQLCIEFYSSLYLFKDGTVNELQKAKKKRKEKREEKRYKYTDKHPCMSANVHNNCVSPIRAALEAFRLAPRSRQGSWY